MPYHPEKPYNELPLLSFEPIALTKEIEKSLDRADKYLSGINERYKWDPFYFLGHLSLKEAKNSCAIENIKATNRALYNHINGEDPDYPHTNSVIANQKAILKQFFRLQEGMDFELNSSTDLVSRIKRFPLEVRKEGNYIGTRDRVIYTPPDKLDVINRLLDNLFEYYNRNTGQHPLVKMAIAHHQFESIHPYIDGNGRAGRALNLLYLVKEGVLEAPIVPLSSAIFKTRDTYYSELNKIRKKENWTSWVKYILKCFNASATFTLSLLGDLEKEYELFDQSLTKLGVENKNEVLDLFSKNPYIPKNSLEFLNLALAPKVVENLKGQKILSEVEWSNQYLYNGLTGILEREPDPLTQAEKRKLAEKKQEKFIDVYLQLESQIRDQL